MFAIDEVLKRTMQSMGEDVYTKYLRHSILFYWKDIVGETNAKHIKPLRIEYKRLFVYIADSSWKPTLYEYKSTFIQKINDFAKKEIIDDILLGNPNERPKEDENVICAPPQVDISKELQKITLTDDELDEINKSCAQIESSSLKNIVLKTSINRMKLEKYKRQNKWHECEKCGALCPQEQRTCDVCTQLEDETFRKTITQILRDVPYATYAEVKKEIERSMPQMIDDFLPHTVESIRTSLIQQTANSLDTKDQNQVNLLVMLYKRIPLDKLNDKIINNTLYELRYNLPMKGRITFER
ncbi:MAG: DUF721 domain-containing protein [Selenomonadaceae bacterium]|nr:DUF721 domain-containing protein [Selenomonadaceae bacterium]MBR1859677.1 DUF721 domain-containing protein [Selenomonadaceae bacterium]